jgi:hypothetical protein
MWFHSAHGGAIWRESPRAIFAVGRRMAGRSAVLNRARQAALLERLRQALGDDLCRLGQIPLEMTHEPRAIIQRAEQVGVCDSPRAVSTFLDAALIFLAIRAFSPTVIAA